MKNKNLSGIPLEPKKINRFSVEFPEKFNIEVWSVSKLNKPIYNNGKWEKIKIEFVDPIGPSTSQGLFKMIKHLDDGLGFTFKINTLDPTGEVIEIWEIDTKKVLVNFGYLDYSIDEWQKPFIVVKPLKCKLVF